MRLTQSQLNTLKQHIKDEKSLQIVLDSLNTPQTAAHRELFLAMANMFARGMILMTPSLNLLAVNQPACDLLQQTESQLIGHNLAQIYPQLTSFSQAILDGKTITDFESTFRLSNGNTISLYLSTNNVIIENTSYLIVAICDMPNCAQSIRSLREREALYHSMVENQMELICHYTVDLEITFANRAYCQYFGYDPQTIAGSNLVELMPPILREWARGHVEYVIRMGKTVQYEREVTLNNGEHRWMQWTDQPLLNSLGEVTSIQAVGRDVTERHRAEMAYLQQQTQLQLMLDSLPGTMLLIFDQTLNCLVAKGRGLEFIGLVPEMMVGQPILELLNREGDSSFEDAYRGALAGEHSELTLHLQSVILRVQIYPLADEQGIIAGVAILEDVTERMNIERQKIELSMETERRQLVTGFVRDASHEFRTPLAIIETALYLVLRSSDDEKRNEGARKIRRQIERISNLVDSLVTIARLNSVSEFHQSNVYIDQIIQALIVRHYDRAVSRKVTIEFKPDEPIPDLKGSNEDLMIAFHHIIDNAIKFSKEEGGTITVTTRQREGFIDVIIQDNGIGIRRGELLRIFERFYRTDASHSTPGLGLGLAIVKAIVEGHGGYIQIDSEKGIGTTAIISLPL